MNIRFDKTNLANFILEQCYPGGQTAVTDVEV